MGRLVLLLMFFTLVGAVPARAAEKGVATDLTWGLSQQAAEQAASAIRDIGAQWASVDISWRAAEPSDDGYSSAEFENLDRGIALARAAGARVVLTVSETPAWASGKQDPRYAPRDPAELAEFYGVLVDRYSQTVDAWQVWNEPNHPHFWQPAPATDPNACATYAGMLKAAAPVIRTGDPTGRVLFAGLAWNDYAYLERCLELTPDLPKFFDVTVTHPYAMAGAAPETQSDSAPQDGRLDYQTFLAYREVRKTLVDHGTPRPIWFTEMGWSTCSDGHPLGCVTPAQQAEYLTRAYELLEADDYVQVALWYSLRNIGSDGPSWLDQLGLHTSDFTPKPAAAAFKAYAPPAPPPGDEPVPGSPAPAPQPVDAPAPGSTAPGAGAVARTTTSVVLKVRRLSRTRIRLFGRVRGAAGGRVQLDLRRRGKDGRVRSSQRVRAGLTARGRFARTVKLARKARWRVRAVYAGTATTGRSASRFVVIRSSR